MMKDLYDISIGLVLAGGGAKGAYEVGVYKALKELEIVDNIKVISGTSIGSINALFFAMDDLKIIESSWNSLKYSQFLFLQENSSVLEKIKNNNTDNNLLEKIRFCDIGLLSQEGISNFIEEYIDMKAVKKSGKEIYVNAYNVDKERPEYFKLNDFSEEEIKERVLASCAVPHLFKPIVINGMRYADGGINSPLYSKNNVDNVPIYPIKSYDCDIIIVVHLSYKNNIDRNGLENSRIIEIYPSTPLEIINGIGTINIKKDTIEHNIKLGYRDAMVIIAPMIIDILKGRSIEALVEKNDENNKKLKI
ncbi:MULTISPECIES: patatin-like phospholipase family protein [unclassified Clostridium]|uniref:patatin-like phospholipase family protein n=1 Tax=unclassified Clostridium TaxID=2614128 RepID=UPI0025BE4636|nr:patatin-like phospholipase family protein [Clostridium sp.]MDY4253783.1 patatin-like phospholipase family protein [Clostridium sp.]